MARLVEAFWAARHHTRADGPRPLDAQALDLILGALWVRGRAAHPDLTIEDSTFAAHLGRCGAPVGSAETTDDLCAEDLYLCCAALLGDEVAIRQMRLAGRTVLTRYLRQLDTSPAFVDEVEQRIWEAALVGTQGSPPKLASYAGKGSFAGWLGVTAQRMALSMRRHEAAEDRAAALSAQTQQVANDPELGFIKDHLRDSFRRAITGALLNLPDHERMIYRLHVVDGLSLGRIAKMCGVAQSTVSRQMAAARAHIMEDAKRALREEMKIDSQDYDSMVRLLRSQLDLSISRLLPELR